MLSSVNHNVDVLLQAGPGNSPCLKYRPGSDVIVLIEAGGFDSRKYGMQKIAIRAALHNFVGLYLYM